MDGTTSRHAQVWGVTIFLERKINVAHLFGNLLHLFVNLLYFILKTMKVHVTDSIRETLLHAAKDSRLPEVNDDEITLLEKMSRRYAVPIAKSHRLHYFH